MHRKDLERRVDRFVHTDAYTVVRQDDVKAGKRRWIVQVNKRPPLIRWGALIGDCLFDFRSALDHLALDLAIAHKGTLTWKQEETSAFPIIHTHRPKKWELDKKIGCVHPEAWKLIKKMQPYGRKDRAALKYLDVLQNFDKHRALHLVTGVSTGLAHFGELDFDYVNFRPFKHGDVLASIPLSGKPKSDQDPSVTFGIAFSEVGPGASAPDVVTTLSWIGLHIRGVTDELLPYL